MRSAFLLSGFGIITAIFYVGIPAFIIYILYRGFKMLENIDSNLKEIKYKLGKMED